MKVNFRIAATESRNIRLEARLIEPTEHQIELLAQDESHEGQRKFLKFHGLAQHPAEDLRSFEIRQLASGNFEFFSDEFCWALECKATNAPMSSVAIVWYGLSPRMGSVSLPLRIPSSTRSM